MRLLIAEDEVDLAEALTAFFEKNQFAVDSVHNGFDAYEYGSSGEYDAIILDVMMPKMNGVEVLQKLRAEGIKTPIMMLTAKAEKDDRITALMPARMTICLSPSSRMNSLRGYGPCYAAMRITTPPCLPGAISPLTPIPVCFPTAGNPSASAAVSFRSWSFLCACPRWFSPLTASWSGYGAGIAMPRSMWCGYTFLICVKRSSLSAAA